VIGVVAAVLIGFWVSRNWRNWAASLASEGIRQGIEASQLPAQEKQEIMVQVDRVAKAFRERTISDEQLGRLIDKLVESPLMSSVMASAIGTQYLDKSGLSEEEKTQGRQTLLRFIRGSIDGKISEEGRDAAMKHVADRDAGRNWQIRRQDQVSDADLKAFLDEAKTQADQAQIPDQPESFDPSDEFKKIIDEAMKEPQ
jgi:hypothetical protein